MLDILDMQLYGLRVSICAALDLGGLHVGAGYDRSVLDESDNWSSGVFGSIDPIHFGGFR